MNYINEKHWLELAQSCISSEIASLNFASIEQEETFSFLVRNPERRNDGRLNEKYLQMWNKFTAAWKFQGHDPLTAKVSEFGCVKLDNPRFCYGDRKLLKYEQVQGLGNSRCFFARINWGTGLLIARRQGFTDIYLARMGVANPSAEDTGFWEWVRLTPKLHILFTEGAKKVSCLISCGFLAIGVPGIYNAYRVDKYKRRTLVDELQLFCHPDREIIFAYDRDEKLKTIEAVDRQIEITAGLFRKLKVKTSRIEWTQQLKGVDDLINQIGTLAFEAIYQGRSVVTRRTYIPESLDKWLPTEVSSRYLDPDIITSKGDLKGKLIAIKSAKGTGKTEAVSKVLQPAIYTGRQILIVTHRIQLGRSLADRVGIAHIDTIGLDEAAAVAGLALCIDSLHFKSKARFNSDGWENSILFLDEVEQLLWHLLHSVTLKHNRVVVLQNFFDLIRTIAQSGGTIIIADADLSSTSIKYFEQIVAGQLETQVIVNNFIPNAEKRELYVCDSPEELLLEIKQAIADGKKVIIHTASQQGKSKYSPQNLKALLLKLFPNLKLLVLDSVTVADKDDPACGALSVLNELLVDYDVVIASPTIETGVSIDIKHFDLVFSFVSGVQTVDAVCQTLERVRDDVPRYISIQTGGLDFIGDGSITPQGLLRAEYSKFTMNSEGLGRVDIQTELEGCKSINLSTWAIYASQINQGFSNYAENIIRKLATEGYRIMANALDLDENAGEIEDLSQMLGAVKNLNYENHIQNVLAQPNPNDLEYQQLKKKTSKTKNDRDREKKGDITRKYGTIDVTAELVVKHDHGWGSKIALFYYLTSSPILLKNRDINQVAALTKTAKDGSTSFLPDFNRSCLHAKVEVLKVIDICQFLDPTKLFTKDDLQGWFDRLLECRVQIKQLLGVKIHPSMTPIQGAQAILGTIGYQLSYMDRHRIDGVLTRFYAGADVNFDNRCEVFDRWRVRDNQLMGHCATPSIDIAEDNGTQFGKKAA